MAGFEGFVLLKLSSIYIRSTIPGNNSVVKRITMLKIS